MICNIKNCNKEAKNLVKIGTYFEFQLCDEHFPSFMESYNKESLRSLMLKELNKLKDKDLDKKLKELEIKLKELKIKMGKVKIIPQETETTTVSKRRKELMKELKDLWESRESE